VPADDMTRLARQINGRCRLRGSFTLRSGQIAAEYSGKCLFESDPALLRAVADRMRPLLPADADLLGGLELGGVPIAVLALRELDPDEGPPGLSGRRL
jgi:orotate phosphoribosyltransferase